MATYFPPNPSFGDEIDSGSKVFTWDGEKWTTDGVQAKSDLAFSATLPIRVNVLDEQVDHDMDMRNLTEVQV